MLIKVNHDTNTLELVSYKHTGDTIFGPYMAMYYMKYHLYTWINCDTVTLEKLQDLTEVSRYEEYIFSLIINDDVSDTEIDTIIKTIGYTPDYILRRMRGPVTILHRTNYMPILSTQGYILSDKVNGEGSYSFGRGVYALMKDPFIDQDLWPQLPNVYEGIYHGEYLMCVADTWNGIKCGYEKQSQQEIIIPFNELDIEWMLD